LECEDRDQVADYVLEPPVMGC